MWQVEGGVARLDGNVSEREDVWNVELGMEPEKAVFIYPRLGSVTSVQQVSDPVDFFALVNA